MKKIIAALTLLVGLSANANVINIEVSDTNVAVGESVSVNLIASGFDDFTLFELDFDFNTSIFNYDTSSFTSDLDLALFEVNQIADSLSLSFFDFLPVSGDFLLASFDLIAVGEGSSSFGFSDTSFFDAFFTELAVDTTDTNLSEVSAPATLGMFALAGLALVGFRRKA